MTIHEAKQLKQSQIIYHSSLRDSQGKPVKFKVLSIKTWKRKPDKVIVSLKYGLFKFLKFNENELSELKV